MTTKRPNDTGPKHSQHPPVIHAFGGSIGSALALLLLYPLERVRIEVQSSSSPQTSGEDTNNSRDDVNDLSPSVASSPTKSYLSIDGEQDSKSKYHNGIKKKDEENRKIHPKYNKSSSANKRTPHTHSSLLQCLMHLYKKRDLYRGAKSVVITTAISNFLYFYTHALFKKLLLSPQEKNLLRSLLASSLAGVVNVLLTNPLWVINTRLILQHRRHDGFVNNNSFISQLCRVVQTEGVKGLYGGTLPSLLLVSNPTIQFATYQQLRFKLSKRRRRRRRGQSIDKPTPFEAFVTGAVAKGLATIITYPLQLTQVLLRQDEQKTTWDCLNELYGREGVAGWYRGMNAKLLQTVLTSAFMFLSYEEILGFVGWLHESGREIME